MQPSSDFTQDSNSKPEEPMSKTKEKRDQFITEIRKKKNQDSINQKRLKFSTNDKTSENPFMLFQMASVGHLSNEATNQGEFGSQLETQLKMANEKFCEAYNRDNWQDVLMIVQGLRLATGDQSNGVTPRMVIELGIVPKVLSLLDDRLSAISKLQSEAAWLIANLTSGDINDTIYLIEQHSIPILTSCIRNKPQELQENAIWALANIATESSITDFRNAILDANALKEVVKEICGAQKRPSYIKIVAWFLKSLLRTPSPEFDKVSISITVLAQLIVHPDEEIQKIAVQSLYFFSMLDDNAKHWVIFAHKLIPKIVSFIENPDLDTKFYALKTSGNLANADAKITTELCSSGILQLLPNCLECQEQEIRREACYTLSNILADKVEGHDAVLDNKILPLLINIIQYDNLEMRFEATACFFNFVLKCSLSEAQMLVSQNILELLLTNLMEDHVKLLRATLETLYHVLVKGDLLRETYSGMNPYVLRVASSDGVHLIENLQYKEDQQIYEKVGKLMDDFFQTETINNEF